MIHQSPNPIELTEQPCIAVKVTKESALTAMRHALKSLTPGGAL